MAGSFADHGSALARYAGRFPVAEINSSFHRSHRPATYLRWAAATPEHFRFAAKLPKAITHGLRLLDADAELERFLGEVSALASKTGVLLVQLPPSLVFDARIAGSFFDLFRARWPGPIACEPRHPTWFGREADRLLRDLEVARVAADPARVPEAIEPGGWPGLRYIRLHGSPRIYYSAYDEAFLAGLADRLSASDTETWCIFDNTASGAACANALALLLAVTSNEETAP